MSDCRSAFRFLRKLHKHKPWFFLLYLQAFLYHRHRNLLRQWTDIWNARKIYSPKLTLSYSNVLSFKRKMQSKYQFKVLILRSKGIQIIWEKHGCGSRMWALGFQRENVKRRWRLPSLSNWEIVISLRQRAAPPMVVEGRKQRLLVMYWVIALWGRESEVRGWCKRQYGVGPDG